MKKTLEVTFEYSDLDLTLNVTRTGNYGEYEYSIKVVRIKPTNGHEPDIYELAGDLKKYDAKIEAEAIEHYEEAMSNQESGYDDDDSAD